MVSSSSRSRSRSDRRGPSPKKASEDVEAKASADASAPEGAVEPKTSTKPAEAAAEAGTPAQPSYSQSRRPGGARKNVRKAGDAGTWECPDCYRVIQDNESSKDQHRVSAYCFSRRLWKVGAFYGDWPTCEKYGKEWANDPDAYELRGCHFYQVKAPKAYLERPRSPPAQRAGDYGTGGRYDRNRHREARSAERSRPERGRSARLRLRSKSGDKKHRKKRQGKAICGSKGRGQSGTICGSKGQGQRSTICGSKRKREACGAL
jgi:hypothetical protein